MSITKAALRFAAPLPRLERFDRFLFLGPHPDDIEIGAGATAAKLAEAGGHVTFLICTDGRYGLDFAPEGTTPEALIAIRQKEAIASAKRLGVTDVRFLPFEDGGFYAEDDLLRAVAAVIGEVQPQVLFAPDPCMNSECHIDHLRTGQCARRLAFCASSQQVMARLGANAAPVQALAYYMTAKPNQFVGTRGAFARQLEALLCHESQFPAGCGALRAVRLYLKLRAVDFGIRSGKGLAEGFRVLGLTHMHCLPEADK
ncbi:MAG: PIG-L family deacetylase [Oscillospiraceae bacterium]|nr:PIG-L family deacetylase [Oscillospiraceae bacterium]